jgi:quinol monooxygenase YgiN
MFKYRALVHYNFKEGDEQKGIKFLENELLKKAKESGCHDFELWHDEHNPQHVIGIGLWNTIEDARKFQSLWSMKERELAHYCREMPHHEIYKIRSSFESKLKKVA